MDDTSRKIWKINFIEIAKRCWCNVFLSCIYVRDQNRILNEEKKTYTKQIALIICRKDSQAKCSNNIIFCLFCEFQELLGKQFCSGVCVCVFLYLFHYFTRKLAWIAAYSWRKSICYTEIFYSNIIMLTIFECFDTISGNKICDNKFIVYELWSSFVKLGKSLTKHFLILYFVFFFMYFPYDLCIQKFIYMPLAFSAYKSDFKLILTFHNRKL